MTTLHRAAALWLGYRRPALGCAALFLPLGACVFGAVLLGSWLWSLFR